MKHSSGVSTTSTELNGSLHLLTTGLNSSSSQVFSLVSLMDFSIHIPGRPDSDLSLVYSSGVPPDSYWREIRVQLSMFKACPITVVDGSFTVAVDFASPLKLAV